LARPPGRPGGGAGASRELRRQVERARARIGRAARFPRDRCAHRRTSGAPSYRLRRQPWRRYARHVTRMRLILVACLLLGIGAVALVLALVASDSPAPAPAPVLEARGFLATFTPSPTPTRAPDARVGAKGECPPLARTMCARPGDAVDLYEDLRLADVLFVKLTYCCS